MSLPSTQRDALSVLVLDNPEEIVHFPLTDKFTFCLDGETILFQDANLGPQQFVAGKDFGDFVVWRPDNVSAYQLACAVDDHEMQISEVVRGEDLLKSTARQILLYRAFGWDVPKFFHCSLVTDESGVRLAKRHDALSLRTLRANGANPDQLRHAWSFANQS